MMNNIDLVKDKLFPSTFENQSNKNPGTALQHDKAVIARITICLTPHHKCTGRYIDFSNSFSIICDCVCHLGQGKDDDKTSDD
ncbi:MAG: hypothetical protein GEU26_12590 [Nitrososphaeraceae archaeon]|nr:hypothetical protein [Nitrososphaeraceae archaeon]